MDAPRQSNLATARDAQRTRRWRYALMMFLSLAVGGSFPSSTPANESYVAAAENAEAFLEQAAEYDRFGEAEAVDAYFQATVQARELLAVASLGGLDLAEVFELYNEALAGLLDTGQRYGRLDPRGQLIVIMGGRQVVVPLKYAGFVWHAHDFARLTPAGDYSNERIKINYQSTGVGVPLVVERFAPTNPGPFLTSWQPFGATAVLSRAAGSFSGYELELYNPLSTDRISINGLAMPLARDLTAPLAAIVNEVPRQYLQGFLAPTDTSTQPQLVMLEPYQRGKIPVVFIHGLYSDPITWVDMINSLRAQSDLYDQFQIWTFRYPTGGNLMESAAALRAMLAQIRGVYDPYHLDPAMGRMVLVGHSLGGLVSKLQITNSQNRMWQAVAVRPFAEVQAPQPIMLRLSQALFFAPVSSVSRVVFIGTPHRGSDMAQRVTGRIGSSLVSFGSEEDAAWQELVEENLGVFRDDIADHRPTTINFLEPDNPLLVTLERLPIRAAVSMHSIIGTAVMKPLAGPGDGVVSVESAQHCGASTFLVDATHEELHKEPESIAEVARILRLHAMTAR
jgi:pimeloyl-ACP methyl ester carboxylesterase